MCTCLTACAKREKKGLGKRVALARAKAGIGEKVLECNYQPQLTLQRHPLRNTPLSAAGCYQNSWLALMFRARAKATRLPRPFFFRLRMRLSGCTYVHVEKGLGTRLSDPGCVVVAVRCYVEAAKSA